MYLGLSPEHNRGEKRQPDCDKLGKMSSDSIGAGHFVLLRCGASVRGFGAPSIRGPSPTYGPF